MSKFFNRNWKAGFTLVELIVVIAILAILAGIAIPVYSGYIKKANEAADNQLLAAVNTAFGAACVQENVDFNSLPDGASSLVIDSDGKITGVGTMSALSGTALQSFKDGFTTYYAGNETTALKYFKNGDIAFYAGEGFKGGGALRSTTFTTTGGQTVTLTAPQDVIDKINESIWTNSDELGVDNLLGSVDQVTGIVAGLFNNANVRTSLTPVLTSDEFVAYALQAIDGGEGKMAQDFQDAVQQYMTANPSATEDEAKSQVVKNLIPQLMQGNPGSKQLVANAMVLYTAANSDTLLSSGWYDTFKNDGGAVNTEKVLSVLNGEPADAQTFAELAAAYAMNMAYDAYASDTGESAMTKTEYLNSAKGQEAFSAYLDTMSLITDNCTNADITAEVLSYGFSGDALIDALSALLGQ